MRKGGISIDFDWKEYLNLAIELSSVDEEAKLRSSISRAYYAAFCTARNYMVDHDHRIIPYDESVHQYVISHYVGNRGSTKSKQRKKIAQELKRMKIERQIADYENNKRDLRQ